jgi:drug/metabolite transporter (DMT)-like permease
MDLFHTLGNHLGELLALGAAVLFALSNVTIALGNNRDNTKGGNGALLSVFISAAIAAVIWPVLGSPPSDLPSQEETLRALGWFTVAGVLSTFLGRDLLYKSIHGLGVVQASAVKRLNPFFSVLLAALILGEVISLSSGSGIGLIAVSFGLLVRESLLRTRENTATGGADKGPGLLDYLYGPGSALAYAFAYITRKFGLEGISDAILGTFVGAIAGIACYYAAALFSSRYRASVLGVFSRANRWQVMAGVFMSLGQLALFGAIHHADVSRVVMIASLEIFITIFMSVYVIRIERRPSPTTLVAAVLATAGVILIAAG